MNVGSLFSGIGGIELGFERHGYKTRWCVEIDPYARAVLAKHFPYATLYADIITLDFTTIPHVDILTGGFPCQDISNAGRRAGITGGRSGLWKEYARAIREIRPRYAIIENVAALINRGLNVVLSDLAEIGYDAEWYNLSASAVGALHRRERLFIIAYPCDARLEGDERARLQKSDEQRIIKQSNTDVSDAVSDDTRGAYQSGEAGDANDQYDNRNKVWDDIRNGGGIWAVEPRLGRVAHGIPNRVDRIKCLGNAVVPQCAEIIAEAIKEGEMTNESAHIAR